MKWFRSNIALKIVSLVLAIVVWFFVKAMTTETHALPHSAAGVFHVLGLLHDAQSVERDAPVHLVLTGQLPPGFEMERTNAVPNVVRVKGPKAVIDSLAAVETVPVDLTERRISFRERVDLVLSNPDVSLVSPARVDVDVRIREITR
jgi:YbbR domain-containing protein